MPTTDWKSRKKLLHSRDGPFGITYAYALVKVMAFYFLFYLFFIIRKTPLLIRNQLQEKDDKVSTLKQKQQQKQKHYGFPVSVPNHNFKTS